MSKKEGFVPEEIAKRKNMSRLAIVRHGEYGRDGRLTENGRRQIEALGERLDLTVGEKDKVLILSSVAPRARESAGILADILLAKVEPYEVLWSEASHPEDLKAAYELVQTKRNQADLLVVVTHFEYGATFPHVLGERDLDGTPYLGSELGTGEGIILNYNNKTITRI